MYCSREGEKGEKNSQAVFSRWLCFDFFYFINLVGEMSGCNL